MRSPALSEFADWFHQTRDMLLWAAAGVGDLDVAQTDLLAACATRS